MCLCLRVLTEGDALSYVPDTLWMDLYHCTDFRGAVSIRVSEETNPDKFKIIGITSSISFSQICPSCYLCFIIL